MNQIIDMNNFFNKVNRNQFTYDIINIKINYVYEYFSITCNFQLIYW